jgi:hypothetical protein
MMEMMEKRGQTEMEMMVEILTIIMEGHLMVVAHSLIDVNGENFLLDIIAVD